MVSGKQINSLLTLSNVTRDRCRVEAVRRLWGGGIVEERTKSCIALNQKIKINDIYGTAAAVIRVCFVAAIQTNKHIYKCLCAVTMHSYTIYRFIMKSEKQEQEWGGDGIVVLPADRKKLI